MQIHVNIEAQVYLPLGQIEAQQLIMVILHAIHELLSKYHIALSDAYADSYESDGEHQMFAETTNLSNAALFDLLGDTFMPLKAEDTALDIFKVQMREGVGEDLDSLLYFQTYICTRELLLTRCVIG